MLKRLTDHILRNNLHEQFQSAYKPNHSTETALMRVQNDILMSVDNKRGVVLIMLDLSAAFDTVDHSLLLGRMRSAGVIGIAHQWFESYPVLAISVGPRPIASPTGRQVCGVVGPAVRQLDWEMELVEGDHGLRGQHTEHRLSNHVFIVEYRLVNPMTINVFLLFASLSFRPS